MVVEARDIEWRPMESRRAELDLLDTDGNQLQLIDYDGANLAVDWTANHQYRIADCRVQSGSGRDTIVLAPSAKTTVEPLGSADDMESLLVIGDTHIGRERHPKHGGEIDPTKAFLRAVKHGIDLGVEAVVHVGDIFHETATEGHAALLRQYVTTPLEKADIPLYYVRGNHWSSYSGDLLDEFTHDRIHNLDPRGVSVGSHVKLYGVDHQSKGDINWSDVQFPSTMPETHSILVLHQTLKQLSGSSPKSVDLARLQRQAPTQFDAVLCGHHHDAVRDTWNRRPVMYTGASEHMSKKPDAIDRVAWLVQLGNDTLSIDRYDIP